MPLVTRNEEVPMTLEKAETLPVFGLPSTIYITPRNVLRFLLTVMTGNEARLIYSGGEVRETIDENAGGETVCAAELYTSEIHANSAAVDARIAALGLSDNRPDRAPE